MNSFNSPSGKLFLLALSFVIHSETPYLAMGRQSSQPANASLAPAYTDQDAYQIYATLLESEKQSLYVIHAEIDGYKGLTRMNLGIEGDKELMREWGAVTQVDILQGALLSAGIFATVRDDGTYYQLLVNKEDAASALKVLETLSEARP